MKKKIICCIPVTEGKGPDPTLLPIDHVYILYAEYIQRTKTIQIRFVLPEDRSNDDSTADFYELYYTVPDDKAQEAEAFCETLMSRAYEGVKVHKRLLVLINPFGGQGKAKEIFEYHVRPIFQAAKCEVTVKSKSKKIIRNVSLHCFFLLLDTQRQGHAIDIAKELDIDAYDAVVTVSGDGVVHEVINGFLARSDAKNVMKKITLGIIPGGTGNSLIISILGEKRGFDPVYTALQVIKGKNLKK